jgi:non-ribosomal peptide synthetase component F
MEDSSRVLPVRLIGAGYCLAGETAFSVGRHSLTFDARVMSDGATLPVNGRRVEEAIMLTMSHAAGANEPAVRDITLGGLLQWAAETTPDRIALIAGVPDPDNRRQWTYAELYAQALRTARALRASFEPGERVAIWAHNILSGSWWSLAPPWRASFW